jgi:Glycosyltransferase
MNIDFDFSKTPGKVLLSRNLHIEGSPLLSVITPFYNAGKFFRETANCVLNQTFPYFEWIIVDDGSTSQDDVNLLKQVASTDSRIVLLHKSNGGPSAARNMGIKQSKSDIIVPLDADDLIEPTFLECVYWSLFTHPEASFSYADSVGFFEQEYIWKQPFSANKMKTENILVYCAGIRKKDLLEIGLQTEEQKYLYEDWHMWLKLLAKRKIGIHMGWIGFWYRRTDTGVLSKIRKNEELESISKKMNSQLAKQVDDDIQFIEYPRIKTSHETAFSKIKTWSWDRKPVISNQKTKILLLLPHMVMGGADLFNLDIVSRIDKNKFEVSVITTNPAESTWRQRFGEHVTDLFELPTFLDVEHWAAFVHYFIRSRNIELLLVSNSYYGYYLIPWLRKEFPDLIILDYVHSETWYWRSGGYARNSGVMGEIIDKTYVCTEHLRNIMIEVFGRNPETVETLYIGVDDEEYNPDLIQAGIIKSRLNISQERPVVLFPCRIDLEKRPFLMLEIAKRLMQRVRDVAVVVVGDGPCLNELREKIRTEGLENTVYCVGRQKDMKPYYKDSDVTLVCSLKEGISLTSYESLAMGVPVVSSDVGGQKELINDKVGKIVPLYQDETKDLDNRNYSDEEINHYVSALHDILKLTNDEKQNLSTECRNRIKHGFTKHQMVKRLECEFSDFKNGEGKENREYVASLLRKLPNLIDDFTTVFHEFIKKDMEANEIWKAKVRFEEMLKNQTTLVEAPANQMNDFAVQELQRIYKMRTWRMIQRYRKFMDGKSGYIFRKVRDLLLNR